MNTLHTFLRPFLTFVVVGVAAAGALLAPDQLWLVCLGVIFLALLYLVLSFVPALPRRAQTAASGAGAPADREQAQRDRFSHSVQMLAGVLLAGFLTLSIHLLREQVVQGPAIAGSRVISQTTESGPDAYQRETELLRGNQVYTFTRTIAGTGVDTGTDSLQNPRLLGQQLRVQRGRIFDAAGRVLADRVVYSDTGYVQRTYPVANMSYLLGYYNPNIYGLAGLEASYDDYLSGQVGVNPLTQERNQLLHQPTVGDDVYLTLVPAIQDAAIQALGPRKGAVAVIDLQSGAILALATYPHIDPNGLAFDPGAADWNTENKRIVDYWNGVISDPNIPMLDRATQGLYPPGSTFKTVTLSAGIDTGKVVPTTVFTDPGHIQLASGGYTHVDCSTCRPAGHPSNSFTLMEGYQWSLNVVFAELAVRALGKDTLTQYAERFGFGQDYKLPIPASVSNLGNIQTVDDLAATSYGQAQVQATPLEMALVAATPPHNGELPRPYIVSKVVDAQGRVVQQAQPGVVGRVMSPQSAATVTGMMITSVQKGWANGAAIPGAVVGGKTGTAETGRGTSHAWFIGIAGKDAQHLQYAVAAMVEEGGEGSRVAVPIGRAALVAALQQTP
jgi:peptidoglycan glycosyltransferase